MIVKIDGEDYDLCACVNCGEVHAVKYAVGVAKIVGKKIKCCRKPLNFWCVDGADKLIKDFVEEFGTEFTEVTK